MHRTVFFRFKIALLAAFVLFTLLGMAAPSMNALFIGAAALGLSLAIAIVSFVNAARRADRELHSSF